LDTIKSAVYLRISDDKTGEALGIARHREDCLRLCAQKGWGPVEYVDNDTSSKAGVDRPAYRQMLSDIASGALQAVVCWHTDRLTRVPIEGEEFMDLVVRMGIERNLATVTGEIDLSTDDGRFMFRIHAAVARQEMERKSARHKSASRQKAQMGKAHSTGRAFGYNTNGTLKTNEANAIRAAHIAMLAGATLYGIAAQWNQQGLTSTRGNRWTGRTVRQVLINGRYAGLRFHLGELVTDDTGQPVKVEWKPIVDRDTWEQTRALLSGQVHRQEQRTQASTHRPGGLRRMRFKDGQHVAQQRPGFRLHLQNVLWSEPRNGADRPVRHRRDRGASGAGRCRRGAGQATPRHIGAH